MQHLPTGLGLARSRPTVPADVTWQAHGYTRPKPPAGPLRGTGYKPALPQIPSTNNTPALALPRTSLSRSLAPTIMASISVPRLLARGAVRPLCRPRPCCPRPQFQRAFLSSKHPSGFVPPAVEDLEELRERVQEFTRRPRPRSFPHYPALRPRQERNHINNS